VAVGDLRAVRVVAPRRRAPASPAARARVVGSLADLLNEHGRRAGTDELIEHEHCRHRYVRVLGGERTLLCHVRRTPAPFHP
jgi:hypothetical protein